MDDRFSPGLGRVNSQLRGMQASAFTLGKGMGQLGAGAGRVATNLLKLGAAGAAAVGAAFLYNLKQGVESLHELELQNAATVAGLKSTGGVSGQTAESIRALAEQYENLNATIDDKVIQSAENVLLTFPKITKDAFEPALAAALDLNQALGGGEEGLQNQIIRVGKALQDPIRGVAALRRVGVAFTEAQEKQIKALVESNDLYGAQRIILAELTTEFGGRFAAAGDTAAGRIAHLHDNVEELQKTLAGPFAGDGGVIDRVVGKLGDFLGEVGTQQAVKNLGESLAGLFDDEALDKGVDALRRGLDLLSPANLAKVGEAAGKAVDFVKKIDFATIGRALEVAGRVAKATIDAFLSLPPAVQAVVIGGLAANKLSGGLLGSGIGNVVKGAGGLLTGGGLLGRGASPANPVFVSAVGGLGGAPIAGKTGLAGASLIQKVFMTGIAVEAGFLLGSAVSNALVSAGVGGIKPAKTFEQGALADTIKAGDIDRIVRGIDSIDENLKPSLTDVGLSLKDSGAAIAIALDIGGVRSQLEQDRQVLLDQLMAQGLTLDQAKALVDSQRAMTEKYGTVAARQINVIDSLKLPLGIGNALTGQIKEAAMATKQVVISAGSAASGAANRMRENLANIQQSSAVTAAKNFSPKFSAYLTTTVTARLSVAQALATQTLYSNIRDDSWSSGH